MIKSFRDKETAKIASGERSRKRPPDIQRRGAIKLVRIDAAATLDETHFGPGDDFKPRYDSAPIFTAFASTTNGVYSSAGPTEMPTMSKSMTSTDDWIENLHPGADMREDLLAEHGVTVAEVAYATGLSVAVIDGFLDGTHRVDAEFDLRMGRFFGFSAGYFLRLQNSYDLIEAKRRIGSMVEAIQPRFDRAA